MKRHWLMKCEPGAYTIADLERDRHTTWEGVLKATRGLQEMMVTQKGSRLSVQPATRAEYDIIVRLGRA